MTQSRSVLAVGLLYGACLAIKGAGKLKLSEVHAAKRSPLSPEELDAIGVPTCPDCGNVAFGTCGCGA